LPASDTISVGAALALFADAEAGRLCQETRAKALLTLIDDANMIAAGKDPSMKPKRKWWALSR